MAFCDAVAYVLFPRCPAERARSVRRRASDVRNNGRGLGQVGPISGIAGIEQGRCTKEGTKHSCLRNSWQRTLREFGAMSRQTYTFEERSGRKPSIMRAMSRFQRKASPNAKIYHTLGGLEAQYSAPREAQSGEEQFRARSGVRNVGMRTVNVGH